MANILYIHGFGSNQNSSTFLALRKTFRQHNFVSDDFDLLNVQGTFERITQLCSKNNIDIIIGKSLGGFYTLLYKGNQNKIVINPCIKPWLEIPKLDKNIKASTLAEWKSISEKAEDNISSEQRINTFGIFGDHDHLFSYKNYFDEKYRAECASLQKSFLVPGDHHIDIEILKTGIQKGFDYFAMMQEYNDVFSMMPYYQLIKAPDDDYLNMSEKEKLLIINSVNRYHNKMIAYQNNKIFGQ